MAPLKKTSSNASAGSPTLATPPPPPAMGPGGPLEIAFTFDTTGSMYRCLAEVRLKVGDIIQRLLADIPNLRIAVFAHGDYCDAAKYVTKYVDFTNDAQKLCDFVQKVASTGGGDWEECYELVLRQARELLSWTPGTQRALVMIGDAIPHPASDPQNKDNIDWREEVNRLRDELGVRIYAVQAYDSAQAVSFWKDLAKLTFGKHLNLEQFDTIVDMMMAICYREHGPEFFEAYEREVRAREGPGIRKEYDRMFDALRDGDAPGCSPAPLAAPATPRPRAVVMPIVPGAPLAKRGVKRPAVYKKSKATAAARKLFKNAAKKSLSDDDVKYTLGRQYRETVPNTNNSFRTLPWSRWQLAMAPAADDSTGTWIPRRHGEVGVRNSDLFHSRMTCPAVYELAVQPKDSRRKYTTSVRQCYGSTTRGHWDTTLLRSGYINGKVSGALQRGCKLFVRRAKLTTSFASEDGQIVHSVDELKKLMKQTYDYAWTNNGVSSRRKITKGGEVILE